MIFHVFEILYEYLHKDLVFTEQKLLFILQFKHKNLLVHVYLCTFHAICYLLSNQYAVLVP